MALSTKATQWKSGTGAGTTTTVTTDFQPKAIVHFGAGSILAAGASGTRADAMFSVGFSTGTTADFGMSVNAEDALATSDTHRSYNSKTHVVTLNTGSTDAWDLASITSTGYTVYASGAPTQDWLVNALAIGGTDITNAMAFEFSMPGTSGAQTQSITTPGFRPDCILLATIQKTNAAPINDDHLALTFGWASGPSEMGCWSMMSKDASGASSCFHITTDRRCLATMTTTGATEKEAMLLGFTDTGFDLRWVRKTDTAAERIICLALQGARFKGSSFSIPSSGTSLTVTGAGFTPAAAIIVGNAQTAKTSSTETDYPATSSTTGTVTAAADIDASFGVIAGTGEALAVWAGDDSGADPMTCDSYQHSAAAYVNCAFGTASVDATLTGHVYNSDGAVFTMTAPAAAHYCLVLWIAASADTASADVTTLSQMQADGHPPLAFVLEIEGYPYLLTTYSDTTAVLAAYTETDWTSAIACLDVPGTYAQEITPFDPQLTGGSMMFTVFPTDDSDQLGVDAWGGALSTGKDGILQTAIDSNDLALTLDDADEFAASGTLYCGTERMTYSSRDTGTEVVTISARGTHAPWAADTETGSRFGHPHRLSSLGTAKHKPLVTDYPRLWAGRWVRLNVHTVQGGTLNSRANAFKAFGGRIEAIKEQRDGSLTISCSDAVGAVGAAMLFTDQFRARVKDGIYMQTRMSIDAAELVWDSTGTLVSNAFSAVTGITVKVGASGANEIEVGYLTADELCSALNRWFASERAAGRLAEDWSIAVRWDGDKGDYRTQITVRWVTAPITGASSACRLRLRMTDDLWQFLGFTRDQLAYSGASYTSEVTLDDTGFDTDETSTWTSASTPLKAIAAQASAQVDGATSIATLDLEESLGTWINQQTLLPAALKSLTVAGESWGALSLSGQLVLAKWVSDTSFTVVWAPQLSAYLRDGNKQGVVAATGERLVSMLYGDAGQIEVTQVLFLQQDFKDVIMRLIVSTGTSGYNHATWDSYAYGLGAGIPYELLGDRFEASVGALATLVPTAAPTVVLDKPTRLGELLLPELQIRNAHLVWSEGLVFVAPSTAQGPDTYSLVDTTNKADLAFTASERSTDLCVTRYKVEYNRSLDGEYRDVIEVVNTGAETDLAGSRPITVKARNTFAATSQLGDTIRDLMVLLGQSVLSIFGAPQIVISRSYDGSLVDLYPGAEALVTDGHVRDPLTGARGITGLPGWVLSTSWDWRSGAGALTGVIIGTEDVTRRALYSPCADVDDTAANGGYNAGTKVLTCYAHSHSASDGTADAAQFPATHKVTVVSYGDDFNAVETWDDTVASQTGNTITLTTGLAGWTSTYKHRVISQARGAAVAGQQTDAYLGDSADGKISGTTLNRRWSSDSAGVSSEILAAGTPSSRYEKIWTATPDLAAEAMPHNPGVQRALARSADNFISYKTAPQAPRLAATAIDATVSTSYALLWCFPLYVGRGDFTASGSYVRKLYCAPQFYRQAGAGTVYVRVTSSAVPPSGSSLGADGHPGGVTFTVPFAQVTFSSTATTYSVATRSSCSLVADQSEGLTWISVEAKVGTGGATVRFHGLAELWLGPLEAP